MELFDFLNKFADYSYDFPLENILGEDSNAIDERSHPEDMEDISIELKKNNIIKKEESVKCVDLILLNRLSVSPHSDKDFLEGIDAKKAYLFVLDMRKSNDFDYTFSLSDFYLYFYKENYPEKGFKKINIGDWVEFDPSEEHALINNFETKLLTVWV